MRNAVAAVIVFVIASAPVTADAQARRVVRVRFLSRNAARVEVIVTAKSQAPHGVLERATALLRSWWSVGNPEAAGLVTSLARPGGNVTGLRGWLWGADPGAGKTMMAGLFMKEPIARAAGDHLRGPAQ